ncbi:DUF4843 domain-containing protein [Salinibacter ruber]|uniref:DUF4843 domain-containing protein n=1 Tax=Salinibacter ruber TaxID=146919 RepID=UPI00216A672B|nr:DUF4843 domain-containing protein [Salinibacter ruber]MCS3750296.1 hypothetical protein [Salinibacter ruber]MCS3756896.1 hypothetical protein [Salinibacter ruber]MCS3860300.1 hypothetical protein [Salinibacter ruber]MCS3953553.1 hypothetical protein [Salinibacter ruber]
MKFVKHPLSVSLAVAILFASIGGCDMFDRRDRSFSDDPKLEFFPLDNGIEESTLDDEGISETSVTTNIQLIGRQRDSDLSVNFTVDDSSTAEEGVHYTLPSTTATIEANSSTAEASINVLNNDQDDGGTNHILYLSLQDSEDVEAAANLKTYTLTIEGSDE